MKNLFAALLGLFASFTTIQSIQAQTIAVPPNDNFRDRIVLFGTNIDTRGDNILATSEQEEPFLYFYNNISRTVWWSWTAPVTATVTVNTFGSSFFSSVQVFTGTNLATLNFVLDERGFFVTGQSVTFTAQQGQTYQIQVAGGLYTINLGAVYSDAGLIRLQIIQSVPKPPNDDFAARQVIPGGGNVITATNAGASREVLEPIHAGQPGGETLWYTWTARTNGRVKISSSSSTIPTILGVYVGVGYGGLFDVSIPTNAGIVNATADNLEFNTLAGESYQIAVDGLGGRVGDITLSVAQGPLLSIAGNLSNGTLGFGRTRVKSSKGLFLNITNNGTETLRIKRMTFPSGFTAKFTGGILPGQTKAVRVVFAPKKRGQTSGQVTIVSNSLSSPTTFRVSGTGL